MEGQAGVEVVLLVTAEHLLAEALAARPEPWPVLLFPLHCWVMVEAENELLHRESSNLGILVARSCGSLQKWSRGAKTRVVDSLLTCE